MTSKSTAFPDSPRGLRAFYRHESGSMAVLALFVFVAMLFVAGMAIDMMRYETERVRMQGASDRAVLAAAAVRPTAPGSLSPQQIAEAYLTAGGVSADSYLGRIEVEDSGTGRQITVAPAAGVPTLLMHMLGINRLDMVTPARALEAIGDPPDIEVVLVLDVSGSMRALTSNGLTRIQNLRIAARDLVEVLFEDTEPGQMAVTLVPYDGWVLPPPGFINNFQNLPQTSFGACIDFTNWGVVTNSLSGNVTRHSCNTASWRQVRPYLSSADEAIPHIDALRDSGTTSIDLGIRFGALFFDPDIRPALQQQISNNQVSTLFSGRPHDWNEENVIRVMVVMTDGENCCFGRADSRSANRSTQDAQTVSVCNALKQQDVLIYAVAFEAPQGGINLMQQCASSENHFFNTTGDGIAEVFRGIGAHIQRQRLRLTL
ncbi:MAG: pilus assembly protein TadG-related protein [Pararhodobacter sp.]